MPSDILLPVPFKSYSWETFNNYDQNFLFEQTELSLEGLEETLNIDTCYGESKARIEDYSLMASSLALHGAAPTQSWPFGFYGALEWGLCPPLQETFSEMMAAQPESAPTALLAPPILQTLTAENEERPLSGELNPNLKESSQLSFFHSFDSGQCLGCSNSAIEDSKTFFRFDSLESLLRPQTGPLSETYEQPELQPKTGQNVSSGLEDEKHKASKEIDAQTQKSYLTWLQLLSESTTGNPEEDAQSSINIDDSTRSLIYLAERFDEVIGLMNVKLHTRKIDDAAKQTVYLSQGFKEVIDLIGFRSDIDKINDVVENPTYAPQESDKTTDLKGFASNSFESYSARVEVQNSVNQIY
ncbi:hypothetical protein TWF506_009425 [Arthrobotrys conoides]|uniref:Uncharacterized protein n=1 Tax=Arthrobotrys conoides TaxID=74498 RepID=A0AAN8RTJ9_9PEZI